MLYLQFVFYFDVVSQSASLWALRIGSLLLFFLMLSAKKKIQYSKASRLTLRKMVITKTRYCYRDFSFLSACCLLFESLCFQYNPFGIQFLNSTLKQIIYHQLHIDDTERCQLITFVEAPVEV